jgi:hypothetical protein
MVTSAMPSKIANLPDGNFALTLALSAPWWEYPPSQLFRLHHGHEAGPARGPVDSRCSKLLTFKNLIAENRYDFERFEASRIASST